MQVATNQELKYLDKMLSNLELDLSVSMAYVRKAQGWTYEALASRFTGVSEQIWRRYMQPGYANMRPIHVVAAFSWVTMIPMTFLYKGFKIRESYRGMDEDAVEALICIANMSSELFDRMLECIYCFLDQHGKQQVDNMRLELERKYSHVNFHDDELLAPSTIDLDLFAEDYYRSIAITVREFRKHHNLTYKTMQDVLGLSAYKYKQLENINDPQPMPMSIGIRVKIGFKLDGHVDFTREMTSYSQFHLLRIVQHIRDSLLVESLRYVPSNQKNYVLELIKGLAFAHTQQK